MITYRVTDRGRTRQIKAVEIIDARNDVSDVRAVIPFAERKGITNVPMGYCINGPAKEIGNVLTTSNLADCDAIAVFGLRNSKIARIAFSHVTGGDPDALDWTHLMRGMQGADLYGVVETGAQWQGPSVKLADSLQQQGVRKILIYRSANFTGRTFGVSVEGYIGEVDVQLVERNSAVKLDGQREKAGFMAKNPGFRSHPEFSMKIPKK